jgi:uncharacterized protein YndB with AHSA1/START domain
MANSNISQVVHVAGTPDQLWRALTNPDALRQCWGIIRSEWTTGAKVEEVSEAGKVLWRGEVVQSHAPQRLSFTFDVVGSNEPTNVTFEIAPPISKVKPNASVVRFAVSQSGFAEDSKLLPECARAWTEILSSIKSYVETGKALPFDWKH